MSISDMIVVMKQGVVQQIGKPQEVYDSPVNLFVAKFLGTPPINVFRGNIREGVLYIGKDALFNVKGAVSQEVYVGIRPEGFVLHPQGALTCHLNGIEVMGRDISVVSTNEACENTVIRSIISAKNSVDTNDQTVRFNVMLDKVFVFSRESEERIYFETEQTGE